MKNNIYTTQNKKDNQELVKTQHFVYKSAKRIEFISFCLMVFAPLVFNIIKNIFQNEILSNCFTLLCLSFTILNNFLLLIINKKKSIGALIQYKFDCNVFDFKRTFNNEEIIDKQIVKYKEKDYSRKINRYADYSKLSHNEAVFRCQQENIRWSKELSTKYLIANSIVSFLTLTFFSITFCIRQITRNEAIAFLACCMPCITYLISNYVSFFKSRKIFVSLDYTVDFISNLINKGIDIEPDINMLEEKINFYRENTYLIPDFFEKIFYKENQKLSNYNAKKFNKIKKKI